jgi:hypothetical protein
MHHLECMLERIDTYLGQDISRNVSDPTKGYKNNVIIHGGSSGLVWTVFYNHEGNAPPLISFMYTYFQCVSSNSDVAGLFGPQVPLFYNFDGYLDRENESILKIKFWQNETPDLNSRRTDPIEVFFKFYCPNVVKEPRK